MTKKVLLFSVVAAAFLSGCDNNFYLDEGCTEDTYRCDNNNIYQCVKADDASEYLTQDYAKTDKATFWKILKTCTNGCNENNECKCPDSCANGCNFDGSCVKAKRLRK